MIKDTVDLCPTNEMNALKYSTGLSATKESYQPQQVHIRTFFEALYKLFFYQCLKKLSHKMDLAFDDVYGQCQV